MKRTNKKDSVYLQTLSLLFVIFSISLTQLNANFLSSQKPPNGVDKGNENSTK